MDEKVKGDFSNDVEWAEKKKSVCCAESENCLVFSNHTESLEINKTFSKMFL